MGGGTSHPCPDVVSVFFGRGGEVEGVSIPCDTCSLDAPWLMHEATRISDQPGACPGCLKIILVWFWGCPVGRFVFSRDCKRKPSVLMSSPILRPTRISLVANDFDKHHWERTLPMESSNDLACST